MARNQVSNLPTDQSCPVIFDNCEPSDEIAGERLDSIIGYVMSVMDVDIRGKTQEDQYNKYSLALTKKFKTFEPYSLTVKLSEKRKERIIQDMKGLLPNPVPKLDKLIESAADKVSEAMDTSPENLGELIYKTKTNEFVFSEFSVLKIFRSGVNLEITPCLMTVKGKKSVGRILFNSWENIESSIDYKQQKYVLTKFKIKSIIKKLEEDDTF